MICFLWALGQKTPKNVFYPRAIIELPSSGSCSSTTSSWRHPSSCPSEQLPAAFKGVVVRKGRDLRPSDFLFSKHYDILLRDIASTKPMHLASGVTERALKLEWRIVDLAKLVGQGFLRSKTSLGHLLISTLFQVAFVELLLPLLGFPQVAKMTLYMSKNKFVTRQDTNAKVSNAISKCRLFLINTANLI